MWKKYLTSSKTALFPFQRLRNHPMEAFYDLAVLYQSKMPTALPQNDHCHQQPNRDGHDSSLEKHLSFTQHVGQSESSGLATRRNLLEGNCGAISCYTC
jgi:hypothetical protein